MVLVVMCVGPGLSPGLVVLLAGPGLSLWLIVFLGACLSPWLLRLLVGPCLVPWLVAQLLGSCLFPRLVVLLLGSCLSPWLVVFLGLAFSLGYVLRSRALAFPRRLCAIVPNYSRSRLFVPRVPALLRWPRAVVPVYLRSQLSSARVLALSRWLSRYLQVLAFYCRLVSCSHIVISPECWLPTPYLVVGSIVVSPFSFSWSCSDSA
jgi:hypothetical protein